MNSVENPFDHILYEMEMYLYSYKAMDLPGIQSSQYAVNLIIDSRAIHLRNLAYFFKKDKKREYWHASDYTNETRDIMFLEDELYAHINEYASRATGHLLEYRKGESYKADTEACFQEAYLCIITAIMSYFDAMDHNARSEHLAQWNNEEIQSRVNNVRTLISSLENTEHYVYHTATTASTSMITIM